MSTDFAAVEQEVRSTSATISWKHNTTDAECEVWWRVVGESSTHQLVPMGICKVVLEDLQPSTTYNVVVKDVKSSSIVCFDITTRGEYTMYKVVNTSLLQYILKLRSRSGLYFATPNSVFTYIQ